MINPQMMGMQMGPLPNVPTIRELWKDEKEKYRHWMILFGVGIFVIFVLLLTSLIINAIDEIAIKTTLAHNVFDQYAQSDQTLVGTEWPGMSIAPKGASGEFKSAWESINSTYQMKYLILPGVQFTLVGIGLIMFVFTIFQSYQEKSFHKLSGAGNMVIGIGAFISVYQLFSMIWSGQVGSFDTRGGLFQFIIYFVVVGVYFSGSMQVARIRRMFVQSFRIEQIKNSPEYKAAMQQMQNQQMQNGQMPPNGFGQNGFGQSGFGQSGYTNGPFGPMGATPTGATPTGTTNQTNAQQTSPEQNQTRAEPSKSSERIELESMKISDLQKVAKKLEISGTSSMKKNELVDAILRVTENN